MIRLRWAHIIPVAALVLGSGLIAAPASAATSGTFTVTGSMNAPRQFPAATLLNNGEVLETGGNIGNATDAELYNPATGTWTVTGSMNVHRAQQTATLLPDGDVLVAGGGGPASAELYNPATGTFSLTGNMTTNRFAATATLLPDGKVLVAGGGSENATTFDALASAELYNPATGTWSPTGSMSTPREDQTATLLPNGEVLVAGGLTSTALPVSSAELYNPATGKWTPTGSMSVARQGANATLLPDGDVLATAGIENADNSPFGELYNPATGQWSPANTAEEFCFDSAVDCRTGSRATLLGDGDVLVAGGFTGSASNPITTTSALLYDPAANTWTTTGSLTTGRERQTATLLRDGQVLVAGGTHFVKHQSTLLTSAELYTP